MNYVIKLLGLLLLLILAQQGAVVHELSHVAGGSMAIDASSIVLDSSCAQCPAFAQVVAPAFSHSFGVPSLARTAYEVGAAPVYAPVEIATPQPRNRGPPL